VKEYKCKREPTILKNQTKKQWRTKIARYSSDAMFVIYRDNLNNNLEMIN